MKPDYKNIPSPRDIVDSYGLRAKKSLGQNFLLDLNITTKIVNNAGNLSGKNVVEIGPGPGGLTQALLNTDATHIYAIEKDDRFIEALAPLKKAYPDRFTIIHQDALKADIKEICAEPRSIVANLPYNIATPLLINWLRNIEHIDSMTLMFQKEVAERITAKPRTKAYGRISIISQWLCEVSKRFDIPPQAFTPSPKVTSTVVHFKSIDDRKDNVDFSIMEKITAAAFGQRRKTLRKSLNSLLKEHTEELLKTTDINPSQRAEELTVDKFVNLAENYQDSFLKEK